MFLSYFISLLPIQQLKFEVIDRALKKGSSAVLEPLLKIFEKYDLAQIFES